MPKHKLTDSFIRNPESFLRKNNLMNKRVEIYDAHERVTGLALRITKTGYKSFVFRYWYHGQAKRFTIGKYPVITLSDARDQARDLYIKVLKGIDPLQDKKDNLKQPEADTLFVELAEEYMNIEFRKLRPKTRKEYRRIIEVELIPALGKIPVKKLHKKHFTKLLDEKAIKDDSPTMANRIGTRLHTILEFGIARGELEKNPASGLKKYEQGENRRERIYDADEIRALWEAFDLEPDPARSVFKILLACAQRSTETRFMHWDHIEYDKPVTITEIIKDDETGKMLHKPKVIKVNLWTIPAELSKSKRKHQVPLPEIALDILEERRKETGGEGYVFESRPGAPLKSIKRPKDRVSTASKVDDFTPHDLRRTATSFMASMRVDRTVLGKILNHKGMSGDNKVIGVYDRHEYLEEKQQALNEWNQRLISIIEEPEKAAENKKSA